MRNYILFMKTNIKPGLNISTLRFAILARFSLRINSSVFPENIEPQMTSIQPLLSL